MQKRVRDLVRQRAADRCEYCCMPQSLTQMTHAVDHVIAQQHKGPALEANLALACFECNSSKGPNIAGIDPQTGQLTRLFHPRVDEWDEHFRWDGAVLVGQSAIGRVTIEVLNINDSERVSFREMLIGFGEFPANT